MDDDHVRVAKIEDADTVMEFPSENDGTLTLSTVQSHFPNAIGLKYKALSGAWRGLRAVDNIFDPPKGGWGDTVYYITETEAQKRKSSNLSFDNTKLLKIGNPLLQDMAVLGLPWTTTTEDVKQYFEEECGELLFCEVKTDRDTGRSRGFGFIRFKTEEGAKAALGYQHHIGGRQLEVKQKKESPMKLFVGRLPMDTTKDDLYEYFSQYGEVKDSYVPSPFKGFGFVTFHSTDVGNFVMQQSHIFRGAHLNLNRGEESKSYNSRNRNGDRRYAEKERSEFGNLLSGKSGQSNREDTEIKARLIAYLQNQL